VISNLVRELIPQEGGGGGTVESVGGGTNINVNAGDPDNPIVNLDTMITSTQVNGVTLETGGSLTNFLDRNGTYTVPPSTVTAGNGIAVSGSEVSIETVADTGGTQPITIYVASLNDLPTPNGSDEIVFDTVGEDVTLVITGAFDLENNSLVFNIDQFFNINGYNDVAASLTSTHPNGTVQVTEASFLGINSVGIGNTGTNSRPIQINDPLCTFFFLNGSAFDFSNSFMNSAEILILQYSDVFIRDTLIRGGIKFEFAQPTSFGRINNCRFNGPEATPAIEFNPDITADSLDIIDCRFEIPSGGVGIQVEDPADITTGTVQGCNWTLTDATSAVLKCQPVPSSVISLTTTAARDVTEDDDGNLIYADATGGTPQIIRLTGHTAVVDAMIAAPASDPYGVEWVNGNLISSDVGSDLIYVHDGFTDTPPTSFAYPSGMGDGGGLAWTGSTLLGVDKATGVVSELDGLSADVLQFFTVAAADAQGIAFDGRNLITYLDDVNHEICVFQGITDTERYRFDTPNNTNDFEGISWIEGGFALVDETANEIHLYDHFVTFDQGSPPWIFSNNTNFEDSRDQFCVRAINNVGATVVVGVGNTGVWLDIALTDELFYNLLAGVEAFSMLDFATGEIEYIGTRTKSFPLSIEIAALGNGGTDNIEIGFSLNGASPSLTPCGISGGVITNSQRASITAPASPLMLSTGDTLKPQIRNLTDEDDITVFESKITGLS